MPMTSRRLVRTIKATCSCIDVTSTMLARTTMIRRLAAWARPKASVRSVSSNWVAEPARRGVELTIGRCLNPY